MIQDSPGRCFTRFITCKVISRIKRENETLFLTIMSDHKDMNKVIKTTVNSYDIHLNKFPFQGITIIPTNLHQIQPRATQVRNYDEIGFEPNGKWNKVVCTYILFQGEIMWKVQTGERAPLWFPYLYFQDLVGNALCLP